MRVRMGRFIPPCRLKVWAMLFGGSETVPRARRSPTAGHGAAAPWREQGLSARRRLRSFTKIDIV